MSRQSEFYKQYLCSKEWHEKKLILTRKRGNRCEKCGCPGSLQLHHITYDRLGRELESDLQLLCAKCHQAADLVRIHKTRYDNARETYIRKKYGDNPPHDVYDEFDRWMKSKY